MSIHVVSSNFCPSANVCSFALHEDNSDCQGLQTYRSLDAFIFAIHKLFPLISISSAVSDDSVLRIRIQKGQNPTIGDSMRILCELRGSSPYTNPIWTGPDGNVIYSREQGVESDFF